MGLRWRSRAGFRSWLRLLRIQAGTGENSINAEGAEERLEGAKEQQQNLKGGVGEGPSPHACHSNRKAVPPNQLPLQLPFAVLRVLAVRNLCVLCVKAVAEPTAS